MSLTQQATTKIYSGLWLILANWFRVPKEPPALPHHDAAAVESLRPSDAWLRYLKFQFWIVFAILDGAIFIAWLACMIAVPLVGAILFLPMLALAILPDILIYVAIHLRYDTTWYILTDRSMRLRRGIWQINETTITFENIQNVVVQQGPLQRWFGIADVVVQTAGGGGGGGGKHQHTATTHMGLIEGLADATRIRDLILSRVNQSRSAGLGDEHHADGVPAPQPVLWTPEHVAVLREIRGILASS